MKRKLQEIAFSNKYASRGFYLLIKTIGRKLGLNFNINYTPEIFKTAKVYGKPLYGLRVTESANSSRQWRFNWKQQSGGELHSVDISNGVAWSNILLEGKDLPAIIESIKGYLHGNKDEARPSAEGQIIRVGGTNINSHELEDELLTAFRERMTLAEQFDEVRSVVRTVVRGNVYLAIILGAGGIGKCLDAEESVELNVSTEFKNFLEENNFLSNQK
jgi:hypothetical protein